MADLHCSRRRFLSALALAGATVSWNARRQGNTRLRTTAEKIDVNEKENHLYFAARVPYNIPNGRFVKRLPGDSWLKLFQEQWNQNRTTKEILGLQSYGTANLIPSLRGLEKFVPKTEAELKAFIERTCYTWEVKVQHGLIEYSSDDDELEMSYHFFDSEFAKKHPERVAFLIHQGVAAHPSRAEERLETQNLCVGSDAVTDLRFKSLGSV